MVILLNLVMYRYTICSLSPLHKKKYQYLNSSQLLYTIAFIYVTFSDFLSVQSSVITVVYDRYFILKYCLFESNQRTSVPYIFYMYEKRNCNRHLPHFWRSSIMFVTAVYRDRINHPPLEEFSQKLIFENFTKNLKRL
jgi:hypothetical protein